MVDIILSIFGETFSSILFVVWIYVIFREQRQKIDELKDENVVISNRITTLIRDINENTQKTSEIFRDCHSNIDSNKKEISRLKMNISGSMSDDFKRIFDAST